MCQFFAPPFIFFGKAIGRRATKHYAYLSGAFHATCHNGVDASSSNAAISDVVTNTCDL